MLKTDLTIIGKLNLFLFFKFKYHLQTSWGLPGSSVVKSPPANAGDAGSIHGSEDPLKKKMATHSSILAWKIPWTDEPSGPWGCKSWTGLSNNNRLPKMEESEEGDKVSLPQQEVYR